MNRAGNGVAIILDVLVNTSEFGEAREVEGVCKGLLGYQPGVVDGAGVGPVARPAPEDAPVRRTEPLGWFDDVEQGDVVGGLGKAIAAVRPGGRRKQSLGNELGEDSLQEVVPDIDITPLLRTALRGARRSASTLSPCTTRSSVRESAHRDPSGTRRVVAAKPARNDLPTGTGSGTGSLEVLSRVSEPTPRARPDPLNHSDACQRTGN